MNNPFFDWLAGTRTRAQRAVEAFRAPLPTQSSSMQTKSRLTAIQAIRLVDYNTGDILKTIGISTLGLDFESAADAGEKAAKKLGFQIKNVTAYSPSVVDIEVRHTARSDRQGRRSR